MSTCFGQRIKNNNEYSEQYSAAQTDELCENSKQKSESESENKFIYMNKEKYNEIIKLKAENMALKNKLKDAEYIIQILKEYDPKNIDIIEDIIRKRNHMNGKDKFSLVDYS